MKVIYYFISFILLFAISAFSIQSSSDCTKVKYAKEVLDGLMRELYGSSNSEDIKNYKILTATYQIISQKNAECPAPVGVDESLITRNFNRIKNSVVVIGGGSSGPSTHKTVDNLLQAMNSNLVTEKELNELIKYKKWIADFENNVTFPNFETDIFKDAILYKKIEKVTESNQVDFNLSEVQRLQKTPLLDQDKINSEILKNLQNNQDVGR